MSVVANGRTARALDVGGVPRHRVGGYVEFSPPPALRPFADAVWVHTANRAGGVPALTAHRVVPDPCLSIAFTCLRDADGRVEAPQLLLIGPVRVPRFFPIERGREMAAVRLQPEWAQPLLDVDPVDHPNGVEELSGVCRRVASPLFDRLVVTRSPTEILDLLIEAVHAIVTRRPAVGRLHELACHAAHALRRHSGRLRIETLARELGFSGRHLRRSLTGAVGLTPKAYASILRFQAVLLAADPVTRPAWSDLAARFGYFDQAHVIQEFKALTGLTPQALHRERRAESVFSKTA